MCVCVHNPNLCDCPYLIQGEGYLHIIILLFTLCCMCHYWLHMVLWSHNGTLMCLLFFLPQTVSLWNDLSDPVFDGVGLVGFKNGANAPLYTFGHHWPMLLLTFCLLLFSLSFLSFYGVVLLCWGLRTDRVSSTLSWPCIVDIF